MCACISVCSPSFFFLSFCLYFSRPARSLSRQLWVAESTKPELWKMSHILVILLYLSQQCSKKIRIKNAPKLSNWSYLALLPYSTFLLTSCHHSSFYLLSSSSRSPRHSRLLLPSPILPLLPTQTLHLDCKPTLAFSLQPQFSVDRRYKTLGWRWIWVKLEKVVRCWYRRLNKAPFAVSQQFKELVKCLEI